MKKTRKRRSKESRIHRHALRSHCPIANALDIVGDRWTLLVMRDLLMLNKTTYKELSTSDEQMPTNILADRLRRLIDHGLIEKSSYQTRPVRYEYRPTPKGRALGPVLASIIRWSNRYIEGTNIPPPGFLSSFEKADPVN